MFAIGSTPSDPNGRSDGSMSSMGETMQPMRRTATETAVTGAAGDGEQKVRATRDAGGMRAIGDEGGKGIPGGGGSGGRIRTTGQGLMSPLLYH